MPQFRKDPIVDRWVIVAPDRARRPMTPAVRSDAARGGPDPFLEGREHETPPEVLAYRPPESPPNGPGWRVRVVPNKFPALLADGDLEHREEGLRASTTGVGAHEVIVECPHFETHLCALPVEHVREVLRAFRERLQSLRADRRLRHALIFKNQGPLAGATIAHAHSQLIATPFVPPVIREELDAARRYFERHGRCVFESLIEEEIAADARIVLQTPAFLVLCPYASRCPFETWIVPRQVGSHFEQASPETVDELGSVLKSVLSRLREAAGDPDFNLVLHSAPFAEDSLPFYRWHVEILPRLAQLAGFEWGSGCFVNPLPPEDAAAALKP